MAIERPTEALTPVELFLESRMERATAPPSAVIADVSVAASVNAPADEVALPPVIFAPWTPTTPFPEPAPAPAKLTLIPEPPLRVALPAPAMVRASMVGEEVARR